MCGAEGRTALADVVDHVVPLIKGGQDVDSNTRNLCHDHHAQVTAEQFGQRAPRVPIGIDGWPVA
ncbi:HNH endonuclease [Sphingomonas sp. SFZ2018-12]|nr:HNH endonuclease [Sphingomonas sp. SFZ2018-12]MCH4893994.1 HNH endonuclease [Sphingomonas sp. SFZ2018-12]